MVNIPLHYINLTHQLSFRIINLNIVHYKRDKRFIHNPKTQGKSVARPGTRLLIILSSVCKSGIKRSVVTHISFPTLIWIVSWYRFPQNMVPRNVSSLAFLELSLICRVSWSICESFNHRLSFVFKYVLNVLVQLIDTSAQLSSA